MMVEYPFPSLFQAAEEARASGMEEALLVPIGFLNDLSQAMTPDEVLSAYSLWSRQIADADRCSIALKEADGQLTITTMTGARGPTPGSRHDLDNNVAGAVYRAGQPILITEPSQVRSPGAQLLAKLGYRTVIVAPIMAQDRCFGVINVSFTQLHTQPGTVLSKLLAIGQCLAMQLKIVEQMQDLSRMAHRDALTGAGNRNALYHQAEAAWADWSMSAIPFSFVAVDIDYFKQINDTYGHDVGDTVLSAFVKRLGTRMRTSDSVIRMGGEEFGVLMMGADLDTATDRARMLCTAIGEDSFSVMGMELHITASFGVTQVLGADTSFDDVMKRADMALYTAKAEGRDQVTVLAETGLAA